MKSDFNKYDKNDLPFDTYTDFPIQSFDYDTQKGDEKNLKKKEKN